MKAGTPGSSQHDLDVPPLSLRIHQRVDRSVIYVAFHNLRCTCRSFSAGTSAQPLYLPAFVPFSLSSVPCVSDTDVVHFESDWLCLPVTS